MQKPFKYLYNNKFSCILKITQSGEIVQRFFIQRCDLMALALVCWDNSIDKLNLEME